MEHYALAAQVFAVGMVFARVGAMAMLLPGVGETGIPPRVRLAFAFLLSLALYPVVRGDLPAEPDALGALVGDILLEVLVGLALGVLLRMFLSALSVAGEVVAIQTNLAYAQTVNPLEAQPATSVSSFLSTLGLALIFSTNLHHLFIGAIAHSFDLFGPGRPPLVGDFGALAVRTLAQTFSLGVQLAAPVLVLSLALNLAAGLIARVLPAFQIFFAATPLTLLLGFSVLAFSLGSVGLIWVDRFRAFTSQLT